MMEVGSGLEATGKSAARRSRDILLISPDVTYPRILPCTVSSMDQSGVMWNERKSYCGPVLGRFVWILVWINGIEIHTIRRIHSSKSISSRKADFIYTSIASAH